MSRLEVDLTDPDTFVAGYPHDYFRRLRAESPVVWHPAAGGSGFWVISKYRDVWNASLDQRTFAFVSNVRGSKDLYLSTR